MTGPASAPSHCRLGVLAFGDSITNGGGELQWGVALQSWALWVARGLALPFTSYAVDGARVEHVVEQQIPAFERLTAGQPHAGYQLGCLYIGVNDVRSPDWDHLAFESRFRSALEFLSGRCELVLTVTAPLDLGRPRQPARVSDLNDVVSGVAGELGTLLLDLRSWGARNLVMTDHVHPTAFGQIDIAERALAVLERAGMRVEVRPSSLISYSPSRRQRLQGDWTYVYRHAKVSARAGWIRASVAIRSVSQSWASVAIRSVSQSWARRGDSQRVAKPGRGAARLRTSTDTPRSECRSLHGTATGPRAVRPTRAPVAPARRQLEPQHIPAPATRAPGLPAPARAATPPTPSFGTLAHELRGERRFTRP